VDQEFVESTQADEFVSNVIVSPPYVRSRDVNLGDDSDKDFEIFRASGSLDVDEVKLASVKRNLADAFDECDGDNLELVSKFQKLDGE
jgi:hypothetical protein